MSLGDAVRAGFRRWSDLGGRSSRSEYWLFWLAMIGAYLFASIVAAAIRSNAVALVIGLAWVVLIIPTLTLFVRRLHDVGRSGWWWLIALVPFGALVLLIFLLLESTPGPNRWGAPPPGSASTDPSTWRQFGYGTPPGWGSNPGPQPGWDGPAGPPSGWGTPGWPPTAPTVPIPPRGPVPAPMPAWQLTQRSGPTVAAPSPWAPPPATNAPPAWPQPQQPPATPPASPAWPQPQQPRQGPSTSTAAAAWTSPQQPSQTQPPAVPAVWSSAATRLCPACGQVADPGAAFCSRCGHALPIG